MEERLMKVATLNVGELKLEDGGEDKFKMLCNLLKTQEFDICCLQETHVNGVELCRWSESDDCAYDAYGTEKHWDYFDKKLKKLVHQAGAAILIRKKWEKHCIRSDLFTTASVNPAQTALNTHIIAVELTSVKILLVSIYVPRWTHFEREHKLRFEQFYKPFLECLDKWKEDRVIVAGDMNDNTSFYETSDWNIFDHLNTRGFNKDRQGGYFKPDRDHQYPWNYEYYLETEGKWKTCRFDYILSKQIVINNEKVFRVQLVQEANETKAQEGKEPMAQEGKEPIKSEDSVLQLKNIEISSCSEDWKAQAGKYYLPHSLLSSEFKLPDEMDVLARELSETSLNDNRK